MPGTQRPARPARASVRRHRRAGIVHAAEARARRRGYVQLGLGVDDQNYRAAQLYLRLGYAEAGCRYIDRYHYRDNDGLRHEVADPARFLIKLLKIEPRPVPPGRDLAP